MAIPPKVGLITALEDASYYIYWSSQSNSVIGLTQLQDWQYRHGESYSCVAALYNFSAVFYGMIIKVRDLPGIICFLFSISSGLSWPSFPALSSGVAP